jgi:adenine deaminase
MMKPNISLLKRTFNWKNKDIRSQADVVDSKLLPTLLLRDALVLNPFLKQWLKIWGLYI